ncbi:hypothetical protein BhaS171_00014 [Bacillus phage vB_BhaS-171]|uniref:head protein n=1 Tax=Bacillus phage vB_BhaS-171 TaxID=1775140 RepID=UPI00074496FB|nr:head protein [Bacillus phage vB_BhaS-171]ALY08070.1 hypothetical protein BhaS171_00014 [Bacillus phage vB_BhaS-171]
MIEIRKALHTFLRQYHSRVYFQSAPTTATFPYIVYDLPNSFTDEELEVFNLDIDVWDNQADTTTLETLASSLWRALDHYQYIDQQIQFVLYKENRLTVIDEDPNIKRRKLIFQMRYFDRR